MKKAIIICLIMFAVATAGCTAVETEKITVASEVADCVGVGPRKCLLIKENGADAWTFLYSGIDGFEYERGYEYVLEIRKEKVENPPADASSIRYILVKILSKTQKTSQGMPPTVGME